MKRLLNKEVKCTFCGKIFIGKKQEKDSRCPDCRKEYLKLWRGKPKTIKRKSEIYRMLRKKALAGYGGKCQCCGEDRFEFLSIDHVNGGGRQERKKLSIQQITTKVIKLNFPKEYRVLCHNCNLSLGFYGYCPHDKELTLWKRTA